MRTSRVPSKEGLLPKIKSKEKISKKMNFQEVINRPTEFENEVLKRYKPKHKVFIPTVQEPIKNMDLKPLKN